MTYTLLHSSKYLRLVCAAPQLVIGVALLFFVCGSLIVWRIPNLYQSEARVDIDTGRTVGEMLTGIDQTHNKAIVTGDDVAELARDLLVTMVNMEKVAVENDILLEVSTYPDKKSVLEELKANLSVSSESLTGPGTGRQGVLSPYHEVGPDRYITISYRDIDPDRSLRVLSSFLDLLLNDIFDGSERKMERSRAFLDAQIETHSSLLSEAKSELTRFRTENARNVSGQSKSDLSGAVFKDPEVQYEFNALDQHYRLIRERYVDFLSRLDRLVASVSEYAVPAPKVVEAPRILPGVVEPNRPLLLALIFIGASALGIAAPILRDLVRQANSS